MGGTLGSSGLRYTISQGNVSNSLGFGGRLGYSFFFHENVGIGTGVRISRYRTNLTINEYSIAFPGLYDGRDRPHYRIVTLSDWEVNKRKLFLEVPLLLQFQTKFGRYQTIGMYANIGAKMKIPFNARHRVTDGSIENQGRYMQWGETIFFDLPHHGFGTDRDFRPSRDVRLRPGFAATAGLGVMIELSRAWDLMVGVYMDYGFTDIQRHRHGPIIYLGQGDLNQYRSVLVSNDIGTVRPFSAGLEVGLRYRLGGSNRPTRQEMIQAREQQQEKEQALAQVAAQRAEEANQRAATAAQREAEANQRAEELAGSLARIEDLLSALARDGRVDRVRGEGDQDVLKVDLDGDILFTTSQFSLSANAMNVLVPLVQILQENPQTTIDIFGHTDNVGSLVYNQRLSTRRANSVVDFLIDMGVDRRQIRRVVGRNFSEPIADNSTEEGRAQNRRVEVWMYVDRQ